MSERRNRASLVRERQALQINRALKGTSRGIEMLPTILSFAAGGALGSAFRCSITLLLAPVSRSWLGRTILINVVGSFLFALFCDTDD
jgi:hypothetical protein